jgi:hypothetical protein
VKYGDVSHVRNTKTIVVTPIVSPMTAVVSPPSVPFAALISRRAKTPHVTDGTASAKAKNG